MKLTVAALQAMKGEGRKIACVVAWDEGTARVLDEAGVEPDQADDSEESDAKLAVFRDFVNSLDVDLPPGEAGPPAEEQSS